MSEQVRILSFYENWVDIMEMCNPEEWYELTTIITNLRFKNIDTDPKTLTNIKVKMAWTAIRPSILKSNRNSRYQEKKNNTELQPNTEFEKEAEISPKQPEIATDSTEIPQEIKRATEGPKEAQIEAQIDEVEEDTVEDENSPIFDDYSDNLYDFLDEHEAHIERWVNQIARGRMFGGQSEFAAIMAKENIDKLSQQLGGKNLTDFEEYINNRIISNLMLINQAV